jgi:hypothetical protein
MGKQTGVSSEIQEKKAVLLQKNKLSMEKSTEVNTINIKKILLTKNPISACLQSQLPPFLFLDEYSRL